MANNKIISASILAANWLEFGREAKDVLAAGADYLHIDVMDNHYVPNLSFGPQICSYFKKSGFKAPLDVHLMIEPTASLMEVAAESGASNITIHPNKQEDLRQNLKRIKNLGCKAGLACNPSESLDYFTKVMDLVDILLLMSVNPGFAGQKYIDSVEPKVTAAKKLIKSQKLDTIIQVDGGIDITNIGTLSNLGVDSFVLGSTIFGSKDYAATITGLRQAIS